MVAFTLVELLVVMAIIAILASLLLPALARAKEKAKVVKVHAELYGVGLALEMYADGHDGQLPPVRVNCNSDLAKHWCQFPCELAQEGYLARGDKPGLSANLEDVFHRGHTYKYATPGLQILNDSPGGNFKLWVPEDFPLGISTNGSIFQTVPSPPCAGCWGAWGRFPIATRHRTRTRPLPTAVGIGGPEMAASSPAWPHARECSSRRHHDDPYE